MALWEVNFLLSNPSSPQEAVTSLVIRLCELPQLRDTQHWEEQPDIHLVSCWYLWMEACTMDN